MKYLIFILISFNLFAQNSTGNHVSGDQSDIASQLEQFRQARKKIMEKMFKDFAEPDEEEFFNDQDFTDTFKMLDQIYKRAGIRPPGSKGNPANRFFKKYGLGSSEISYVWEEGKNEKILKIKLKDKNTPIDLDVNEEMISIKGKVVHKTENGSQMSSFQNSFSVPAEVDGSKVKIESQGNDILVRLPYKKEFKTKHNTRFKPSSGPVIDQQRSKPSKRDLSKPLPGEISI